MLAHELVDIFAIWRRGLSAQAGDCERAGGVGKPHGLKERRSLGKGNGECAVEYVASGSGVDLLHVETGT